MSGVAIILGAYKRSLFAEARVVNCFAERAPTQQEKQYALIARGGLTTLTTVGAARARCLFLKAGLFSDRATIVSDQTAYLLEQSGAVTTLSGSLPGSGYVEIDGGQDADLNSVARVATGSALYAITEADGVMQEDFPASGGAGASSVCYHRQYWFATEAGTDQVFYLVPGDTSWTALSFVSAEYAPDKIVAVRSRGDQIVLLGAETTEPWALTGDASPAIAPYGGLTFDFGCRSAASAVNVSSHLLWVDNHCNVRLFDGGSADIVSDDGLAEQIRGVAAEDLRASTFQVGLHTFYVLHLGTTATWVYDLSTKLWHQRTSNGRDFWRAGMLASLGDTAYAADSLSATIYTVDSTSRTDDGTTYTVRFPAYIELSEGQVPLTSLELICDNGDAPISGQGSDPLIQMRLSHDGARTWGSWKQRPMGKIGEYSKRVRWNALGTGKAPYGVWCDFLISEPVGRRFSDLRLNAPP